MPDVHALLSASSSKQWLHCPPSVRLQENFPNESSVYAEEGTFAHEICEYKVRKYLHERVKRPQSEEFDTEEIEQITDVYAEFVISIIEQMRENGCEPLAFVEERVDYSHIAPSGFGTADMLIIGKDENGRGLLHVCDFKTGKGVFVDADHNSQMMLYALGGLAAYGFLYDIEIVRTPMKNPRMRRSVWRKCCISTTFIIQNPKHGSRANGSMRSCTHWRYEYGSEEKQGQVRSEQGSLGKDHSVER